MIIFARTFHFPINTGEKRLDRSIYDTEAGVATMLGSYDDLYRLYQARREAVYMRHEHLMPFIVLGRIRLDKCGNWWKLERTVFTEDLRRQMPPVMTDQEFHDFAAQNGLEEGRLIEGIEGSSSGLPWPPGLVCTSCGGGLKLENCHDYDDEGDFIEGKPPDEVVGKTLRQAEDWLNLRGNAVYSVDTAVRNDLWMVDNPDGPFSEAEGWRDENSKDTPITMDYVIQPGDEWSVRAQCYYHGACYRELLAEQNTASEQAMADGLKEMLEQSGFDAVVVTKSVIPKHIRDWMRQGGDLDDDLDLDEAASEMTYLRVKTAQGNFGFWFAAYPAIDLTGSGVKIGELVPEMAAAPAGFPDICGFDGDPALLVRLWQLLVKRQKNQP
jgi:hypothetical protein